MPRRRKRQKSQKSQKSQKTRKHPTQKTRKRTRQRLWGGSQEPEPDEPEPEPCPLCTTEPENWLEHLIRIRLLDPYLTIGTIGPLSETNHAMSDHIKTFLELHTDRTFTHQEFVQYLMGLKFVRRNGGALRYAPEELRGDTLFVLAAVAHNGRALQFANEGLRGDRDVVLAAVAQNGSALRYASEELLAELRQLDLS